MHCWKTYINSRHQFYRWFFISSLIALFLFIVSYVFLQAVIEQPFRSDYFYLFIICTILLYPLHKLLHVLPLLYYYKQINWEVERYFVILPIIHIKFKYPIPKYKFAMSLILPYVTINIALISLIYAIPQYGHYLSILFAYHNGISFLNLTVLKSLIFSPKNALVEETKDGFEILVNDK